MPSANEKLLRFLARTDVAEVAMAAGRLPCAKVGTAFKPISTAPMETEAIMELLFPAGGSRFVDHLGEKPTQWSFRLDLVGTVAVAAIQRGGALQARFLLMKRDEDANAPIPEFPRPAQTATSLGDVAERATAAAAVVPRGPLPRTLPSAQRPDLGSTAASGVPEPASSEPTADHASGVVPTAAAKADGVFDLDYSPRVAPPVIEPPPRLDAPPPAVVPLELDYERNAKIAAAAAAGALALPPLEGLRVPGAAAPAPTAAAAASLRAGLVGGVPALLKESSNGSLAYALEFNANQAALRRSSGHLRAVRTESYDGTLGPILEGALAANASDVHMVSGRPVMFRIAGDLLTRGLPPPEEALNASILSLVPDRMRRTSSARARATSAWRTTRSVASAST